MLISYLWLREIADFDLSPEELCAVLTGLGLESSIADDRRGWHEGIVIGKVIEARPHPNADKLSLCRVDTGDGVKNIVCGAPNVAAGQIVPVALPGAVLPGGLEIEKRKVRGEPSEGMILSEAELKLSDDHAGIMVLDEGEPGDNFYDRYEVRDTVIEVDLTPNRGDCLSMIGVAREVAAATGNKLTPPPAVIAEDGEAAEKFITVTLAAPELCPRYAARVIRGAKLAPSPFWMRRRLSALGVRPINNIVDITNYVLMETGHPLHAFDHDRIEGGGIIVRRAADGEVFRTLDGKERRLTPDHLVIADAVKAVALAGVMGGENSEVGESTRNILLEAAFFDPRAIRRSGKSLGVSSESSYRFERGTDIEGLIYAQDRAAALMQKLAGAKVLKGRVDAYPVPAARREITLRLSRLEKILGMSVKREAAEEILRRLDMPAVKSGEDFIRVAAPFFRSDIEREIDLVEEIARHAGYGKVPSAIPRVAEKERGESESLALRRAVRRHLISIGMMEGMRMSFINPADLDRLNIPAGHAYRNLVPIDNPLSADWTHLRPSLLPGLISAMKGNDDARIFEIGVVFEGMGGDAPLERWAIGGVISETARPNVWDGRAPKRDFFHLKGVAESILSFLGLDGRYAFTPSSHPFYYPRRQADIIVDGEVIGFMGQVHPRTIEAYGIAQELFAFEMDADALSRIKTAPPVFRPLPRFPSVKRDLAVVAPEKVPAEDIIASIRKHGGPTLRGVDIFDVYRGEKIGENLKSMAFYLEFRDDEKTLTDDQIDRLFESIVKGLEQDHGAKLR